VQYSESRAQEKPQQPRPVHTQPDVPKAPSPEPIPLSALKKVTKGPSKENLSQLKDALKDIVEKAKKESAVVKTTEDKSVHESKKESPVSNSTPRPESDKTEPVKPKEPTQNRESVRSTVETKQVQEVPEDVLRRVLDIKKGR
ncbi:MAG TPA: hypothetical protein VK145_01190, partial [Candidatus Nanoarchaeia archaeon]|nr:hypothetical protein [Candidatus Nanoarchaeia archaeon]